MNSTVMLQYVKWFRQQLLHNNWVVLFVDGHKSHMSLELAKFCVENRIFLIALYPNSTRILQPLDVGCFGGLKAKYRSEVTAWALNHPTSTFDVENIAPILEKVNESVMTQKTIQASFRKTGIFPWDVNNIDFSRCLGEKIPSTIEKAQVTSSEPVIDADMTWDGEE